MAVGINPRYSALTPPSSLITLRVIPHIVRSRGEKTDCAVDRAVVDAVWYADARAGCEAVEDVAAACSGIDAVAIDNRERMRSKGYVVPI